MASLLAMPQCRCPQLLTQEFSRASTLMRSAGKASANDSLKAATLACLHDNRQDRGSAHLIRSSTGAGAGIFARKHQITRGGRHGFQDSRIADVDAV